MHENKNIIERSDGNYIVRTVNGLFEPNITSFVASIYMNHPDYSFSISFDQLLKEMIEQDKRFERYTTTLTVYSQDGEILGTIRKIKAETDICLPVVKEFNIDLSDIINQNLPVHEVAEIGRFAVREYDPKVIEILLDKSFFYINDNDLFLSALDGHVLKRFRKMGFSWRNIAKPKYFMGSLTYPVALKMKDIVEKVHSSEIKIYL